MVIVVNKKEFLREFINKISSKSSLLTMFIRDIFDYKNFYDYSYLFRMKEEDNSIIFDIYDNVSDNRFNRYIFIFDSGKYDIKTVEECNVFVTNIYVHSVREGNDSKLLKFAYLLNLEYDEMERYASLFLSKKIVEVLVRIIKKVNK